MPVAPTELSAHEAGLMIRERRRVLGMTQEQVVEQTGLSSQSYLSSFEKGRYHIGRSEHFPAVARVLGLSREDIELLRPGSIVEIAAPEPAPHPLSPAALGYRDIPERVVEIPDELKEAAELYGHLPAFAGIKERRWQVFMSDNNRRRVTPSTPEGWLDDYSQLKRMGFDPPDDGA